MADSKLGAQNLAREATHDIDVKNGGSKATEAQVRETETNAYSASRAVDNGFGAYWTEKQFQDAVDSSMKFWKDQQPADFSYLEAALLPVLSREDSWDSSGSIKRYGLLL